MWIYEGIFRKLPTALSRCLKMAFAVVILEKMLLELTVHIAGLVEMMNMQLTGYWFWDAFGKQPRGKQ